MIPSELLSMQEILTNSIYKYDISKEFSYWMKYNHYPIVSWTEESNSKGKLTQNFSTTRYGIWWTPTRLVLKPLSIEGFPSQQPSRIGPYELSWQEPCWDIRHVQADWITIDIRQAGKYVSKLFIFIFIFIFIHFM